MWASLEDRRNGVGYFSDPMGKPSLLAYWRTLAEMSLSTTFLLSKQPTEEGLTAAMSSPTSAWGDDGVAVSLASTAVLVALVSRGTLWY